MENLFSYGTLQKPKVQIDLFDRILQGSPDDLKGYKIAPIEIRDEAFLSTGEQKDQRIAIASGKEYDIIHGTVFEMTEEELFLADSYEPKDYKRIKVVLASGKEAWIYAAAETT